MWARWKPVCGLIVALTLLTATAAACSGPSGDPDEILVYSGQNKLLTRAWADAFTGQTGIRVVFRDGADTDLGDQIVAEGAGSPADVLLAENSPVMDQVAKAGLFTGVDPATLGQVSPADRPSSGVWTGIAARPAAFVYNTARVPADRLPASLLDLQQPQWQGRWGGSSGPDFRALVAALLQLKGPDATRAWLRSMKANAVVSQSVLTTMKDVDAGRLDGGLIYADYWYRDRAAPRAPGLLSAATALDYLKNQDPGAFVSLSGGAVLKSSRKQAAAQQFLRFVTSTQGQEVLRDSPAMEYPIAPGMAANPALPPLAALEAPIIDPDRLDSDEVTRLMTDAGLLS